MFAVKGLLLLLFYCLICTCQLVKRSDDQSPLEAVVAKLTSDFQALEAKVTALTSSVGRLKDRVGFSVTVSQEFSLPKGNRVNFDSIIYNEGHGYVTSSKAFVAPVSGMYCIYIKTETAPDHESGFEVFKESTKLLHIYGPSHDAHLTPFDAVVTHLDAGQRVWVNTCCQNGPPVLVRTATHFGGFLIHSDNE